MVSLAAVLGLACGSGAASAAPAFSEQAAATIDSAAAAQLAAGKSAGLAVAIVQNGKVVFARGYGKANLEWNTAVTPDTVFRIASNTKTFTATSVLLLVEQGALSLDDRLNKFFPDFPRGGEVSVRQLLSHTSGITTFDDLYHDKPELTIQRTMPEMVAFISHLDPLYRFTPGTAYQYSNSGYYLLGAIVEKVSRVSLQQFMSEHIFKKIGLEHTAMDAIEDIVPLRASGYMRDDAKPGVFHNAPYIPYTTPGPAGGLRSSVVDLARWHSALFGGKLLGPVMLKQMTSPGTLNDGRLSSESLYGIDLKSLQAPYHYGFGIRIANLQGHRELWHSGAIEGFTSQIRTYPDDHVTIALLANTFRALDGFVGAVQQAALGLSERPAN